MDAAPGVRLTGLAAGVVAVAICVHLIISASHTGADDVGMVAGQVIVTLGCAAVVVAPLAIRIRRTFALLPIAAPPPTVHPAPFHLIMGAPTGRPPPLHLVLQVIRD